MSAPDETTGKKSSGTAAEIARAALYTEVGQRIRSVRTNLNIGQAECARGAGIDTSSMFRIEKTGQNLTVDTLARLAISLGVTMDELLLGVIPDPDLIEPRSRG
ncbi:MAG: XRE family transcriptional regulator [Oxalobacteraceae bacterium]|nr:MAG: XRE family transcriptional regulator [Oxalobacteraceae bacterium]